MDAPLPPLTLEMRPFGLSDLAGLSGLEMVGPDCEIRGMNYLDCPEALRPTALTFAATTSLLERFLNADFAACVVPESLGREAESLFLRPTRTGRRIGRSMLC